MVSLVKVITSRRCSSIIKLLIAILSSLSVGKGYYFASLGVYVYKTLGCIRVLSSAEREIKT